MMSELTVRNWTIVSLSSTHSFLLQGASGELVLRDGRFQRAFKGQRKVRDKNWKHDTTNFDFELRNLPRKIIQEINCSCGPEKSYELQNSFNLICIIMHMNEWIQVVCKNEGVYVEFYERNQDKKVVGLVHRSMKFTPVPLRNKIIAFLKI